MSLSRHGRRKSLREVRAVNSVFLAEALERRLCFSTFTVSTLADSGLGSLRQAIINANTAGGTDLINFTTGSGTIGLGSALPAFNANITVDGLGANVLTVNGNGHGSVFSINSGSTSTIENLTISGGSGTSMNGSDYGGGVFNRGNLTITDSTISGNTASGAAGAGGGIYSVGFAASVVVNDSTISGNTAGQYGGGITLNYGTLTVSDSTLNGNSAKFGGGFFGRGVESFIDSTISGNSATSSTGGVDVELGTTGTFSTTVDGTIIAGNTGGDFANTGSKPATGSHDLIGDGSDAGVFTSSLRGTSGSPLNPLLGSLAFNGGPTETMALASASPALGTGAAFSGITTDQRGAPRPSSAGIDIGAYQVLTVNTLADPATVTAGIISLREAITDANSFGGTQEIAFASGLTGTIDLASMLPALSANITIDGPGANVLTVNAQSHGPVFSIDFGVTAEIENLTITGGAGTYNSGNGGGISNRGTLTVANSTISGNGVSGGFADGGGIYTGDQGSSLTVIDCTISGNASAGDAGGIAMNYGSLSITNSTITGNSAPGQGGGIYGRGTITITDTTISENTGGSAGGMYVGAGSGVAYNCTVDGSIIAANIGGDFGTYGKAVLSGASDLIGDGSDNGAFANSLRGTSGTPLNAKLAPLATNGGPTETIALLAGSPAIGTGAIFNGITTDQRGDSRPTAGGSDIGAYQVSTLIVNTLGDPATPMLGFLSLREAIAAANSSGGTEEIAFAPGLTGTINLASTLPAFTANIAIDGPGANVLTVNGNSHGSVFSINQSVTAEIEGLTITGGTGTPANGSNYGGGIHNLGNLTLTNSTITGNTATGSFGDGGGIYSSGFASQLSITDSTLSGNTSGQYGGAISLNYGTLTVSDSTITGNISHAGAGFFGRGSESFFDDTISGNLANLTGGVYVELGTLGTFSCTVDGTIIANNFGGDFANTSHTAATGSNDLIGDGSDNGVFTSSLRGTSGSPLSPKLASLAFNGGPTETMALQSGSPAIGTGAAFDAITTDQRGAPRPSGAGIDIGAYQVLVVNTLTDPVNQTSGILSLREAIVAANSLGGSQEITFLPGLTGTIALASVLPSITANVQIDGPGVSILTVNGENLGSVFTINPSAAVEINDLTITGGGMTDNGSLTTEGNVVTGAITGGGGLTVGAGLAAKLTLSMGAGPSAVTSLTLNTNATLNITNNSLIINYGTNPDPVTAVATALGTGYAGGAWTGAGIDSSTAASGSPGQTLSVGYDDGKTDIGAAVIGQLVLKYTLAGDYNLDGLVNFNDLVTVVQNFNKAGTDWAHGNFLFGSSTNFNDLVAVVQNFNKILTPAASTAQQSGGMIIPLAQAAAPPTPKKPAPVVSSNNYLAVPAAAQPASANEADENVLRSSSDDGSILES